MSVSLKESIYTDVYFQRGWMKEWTDIFKSESVRGGGGQQLTETRDSSEMLLMRTETFRKMLVSN